MSPLSFKKYAIKCLVAICALASFPSLAYTLNLTIRGDTVIYDNSPAPIATNGSNKYITLSDWTTLEKLTPTERWQPGLFISSAPNFELIAWGASGASGNISLPESALQVVGGQYQLGNTVAGSAPEESSLITGGSGAQCSDSSFSGGTVTLYNSTRLATECYSSFSITTPGSQLMPFYFVRPVLKIDEVALVQAMKDATNTNYAPGTMYFGSMTVTSKYYFRYGNVNGTTTVHNLPTQSMTVRISYIKDELLDVQATRYQEIIPEYDTATQTVKGNTQFKVDVFGTFSTGIKMTFTKPGGEKYEMTHQGLLNTGDDVEIDANNEAIVNNQDPDGYYSSKPIPYYIKCTVCDSSNLRGTYIVEQGELVNSQQSMTVKVPHSGGDFSYNLDVGYENIHADDVISGLYMDTFTVLFELDL